MTTYQTVYLILVLVGLGTISFTIGGNLLGSWGFTLMWFMFCCTNLIIGEIKNLKDK